MNAPTSLRIGLAAARNAPSVEERLQTVDRFLDEAAAQDVAIVCFPETYIPGLRGKDFPVPPPDQRRQQAALEAVRAAAQRHRVAVVIGMEWESAAGLHNVAFVISRDGAVEGYQAKNQIPLEEEPFYVPDGRRRLFEVDGVPFGITICHEGWRYPEERPLVGRPRRAAGLPPAAHGQRPHRPDHRPLGGPELALLREGDGGAQRREHDLLRQRQLRDALPGFRDQPDRSGRGVPRLRPLRPGAAAGPRPRPVAGHRASAPGATTRPSIRPCEPWRRLIPSSSGAPPGGISRRPGRRARRRAP